METISKFIDKIIHLRPWVFGTFYIGNIVIFALIYFYFFNQSFKLMDSLTCSQAFYFSVVTVTTLGYGDIIPELTENPLLQFIVFQVVSGILIIGLFLNSIAQKISDIQDKKRQQEKEREEVILLSKQMALFKPALNDHLKILAEIYRVTSNQYSNHFHITPSELFNSKYYNTICKLDFFVKTSTFRNGIETKLFWCEYLIEEFNRFTTNIDDFLLKFSTSLPIELIENLTNIKSNVFLKMPVLELSMYNQFKSQGLNAPSAANIGFSLECPDSGFELPEEEKAVKNYHQILLRLIDIIDNLSPDDKIKVFIRFDPKYPGIGSARR